MDHVIGGRKEDVEIIAKSERVTPKNAKEFLQQIKVFNLFPENRTKIIFVEKDDPLSTAFKLLIDNKILSVPVYNPKRDQFMGFLDMLDIVTHAFASVKGLKGYNLDELLKNPSFINSKCGDVASISGRNPFYTVDENAPLLVAMELMAKNKVHRVPIVDSSGSLSTIITQSHVVKILSDNIDIFPFSMKKLKELGLGTKNVYSVSENEPAIEAFKIIQSQKISAVAVVDANGTLIGNISASDLGVRIYTLKFLQTLILLLKHFRKLVMMLN